MSLGQSDVPGPEGPAAVARIPGEGGERIGGGEEDRRAAQQPGEEEEEEEGSSSSCDLTERLFFFSFSKSGGKTEPQTFQRKTFTLKERGSFLCEQISLHHRDNRSILSAHICFSSHWLQRGALGLTPPTEHRAGGS